MQFLILGLVVGAMLLFDSAVTADASNLGARVTVTIGFIIITGFFSGRLIKKLGMPQLTGYLLAGTLCGPYVLDLIASDVKGTIQVIDDLALAFIAFHAGGEMDAVWLRKRAKSLASLLGFGVLGVFFGVSGGMYAFFLLTGFDVGGGPAELIAAAVVLGVMATGMSPATTIAIILESRAKGALADTVMAITVAADLVIIVLFTLTVNLVNAALDPEHGGGVMHAVTEISWEVGGSLGFGAILGGVVILFLQRMPQQAFIFLLGLSAILIEVSSATHLSLLLICMIAGFVVKNFSEQGHTLIEGIDIGSVGVYIIFFTLAGVGLNFDVVAQVWPVALFFCFLRTVFFVIGTYTGGVIGGVEGKIRNWAWTGFLGQAGVSLGMAVIISKKLPYFSSELTAVILSTIILDQVVGPILFMRILHRVGEAEGTA